MKKLVKLFLAISMILAMVGCGQKEKKTQIAIDYADSTCFEAELNRGTDCVGKIVKFKIVDVQPDSAVGFNLWAGEHLNFISEKDPGVKAGEEITVKIIKSEESLGSWFLTYEIVNNAVETKDTISSNDSDKNLVLTETKWFADLGLFDAAYIHYCGFIHNPNDKLIAEFPKLCITIKSQDGKILGTDELTGSIIMPGDTIALVSQTSIPASQYSDDIVVEFEVKIDELTYSPLINQPVSTSELEITNLSEQNDTGILTGEITNQSNSDLDNVNINMILRKNGEIVYFDREYLDNLSSGKTKAFEINSYEAYPDYDTVEVVAIPW